MTTPEPVTVACPACAEPLHVTRRAAHGERARCCACRAPLTIHRTPDTELEVHPA